MKNIALISLCTLALVLQSCREGDDGNTKSCFKIFEAKNESNKKAVIYLFKPNNSLFKQVTIDVGDSSILDQGNCNAPHTPEYLLTISLDSAIIEFSDGKRLIQTFGNRIKMDTVNNILSNLSYISSNNKMRFNLRQLDYQRAK
ncbi:MAG: hypothetical protein M0R38_11625 [Bacteroidia bacterium]|nr:hypothetical protein [Bacteroidia bacterium]